jgi:hypothetical protein
MREPPCRKFSLRDAMILIAAIAVGLGLNRMTGWTFPLALEESWSRGMSYLTAIQQAVMACSPCLATLTLAYFVVRMRRPRPRARFLARQPGMVACCAALLGLTVYVVQTLGYVVSTRASTSYVMQGGYVSMWVDLVGFTILGAWLAMILFRRWTPRRCWIDLFGRLIGFAWIGLTFLGFLSLIVPGIVDQWILR